jgi:hypothetical protein
VTPSIPCPTAEPPLQQEVSGCVQRSPYQLFREGGRSVRLMDGTLLDLTDSDGSFGKDQQPRGFLYWPAQDGGPEDNPFRLRGLSLRLITDSMKEVTC